MLSQSRFRYSVASPRRTKTKVIAVRSLDEAIEAAISGGNPWTAFLREQGQGRGSTVPASQAQPAQLAAKL